MGTEANKNKPGTNAWAQPGTTPTSRRQLTPGIFPPEPGTPGPGEEPPGIFPSGPDNNQAPYIGDEPGLFPPEYPRDTVASQDSSDSEYGIFPPEQGAESYQGAESQESHPLAGKFGSVIETLGYAAAGNRLAIGLENSLKAGGYLAGSVVGQGNAFANLFGKGGKVGADTLRIFNIGHQLYKLNRGDNIKQTFGNIQGMTGRSSASGAMVQTLSTLALSPLGTRNAVEFGNRLGQRIDNIASKKQGNIDLYN
jgi:hypothetical protein